MDFVKVLIIAPGFEQRISKMAYSFDKLGIPCEVIAEEAQVADEFQNYIRNIPFSQIPTNRFRRTPLGRKRAAFLKAKIRSSIPEEGKLLIIARDVNYGAIVGKIVRRIGSKRICLLTDVADNYDLLYASFSNPVKRIALKAGFKYLSGYAFSRSDAVIIVAPVNEQRIRDAFPVLRKKGVYVLRNLPLYYKYCRSEQKIDKSFVYVGKIDEISRDPMYVIEKLKELEGYTLHFYSSQKESTLQKLCSYAESLGIRDRVFLHDRVPYDQLPTEISRYTYGLVPHKRSPVTDYTVPNKIYDYKSSGIVTIMSDCPALVYENAQFGFGVVYSKEQDNFTEAVREAEQYQLDFAVPMPAWADEFDALIRALKAV